MPDNSPESAIATCHSIAEYIGDMNVLTRKQLRYYQGKYIAGWEFFGLQPIKGTSLRLLLPVDTPFLSPVVGTWPPISQLKYPHVETQGILCLHDPEKGFSRDTKALALLFLDLAYQLFELNAAEEFQNEFVTYWDVNSKWFTHSITSLCRPIGPSRFVYATYIHAKLVIADNEDQVVHWIKNYRLGTQKIDTFKIPFVWVNTPLVPSEYPTKIGDLKQMCPNVGIDELALDFIKSEGSVHFPFLIGAKSDTGSGIVAGTAKLPTLQQLRRGYRFNIPPKVVALRLNETKVDHRTLDRADHSWVHGRDQNMQANILSQKKVLVFGAGSLGSGLIDMLAKAGVGTIEIVDPQKMGSENSSRHLLGFNSVGKNKAVEVANAIKNRMPHLTVEGRAIKAEEFLSREKKRLENFDLIISAIGIWKSESLIDNAMRNIVNPPTVLYCWGEQHFCAGHALAIHRGNGCLNCLLSDDGQTRIPISDWGEKTTSKTTPLCGGVFQAYGATECASIQTLQAKTAIGLLLKKINESTHQVWYGDENELIENGGRWNPQWEEKYGEIGEGNRSATVDFDFGCEECSTVRQSNSLHQLETPQSFSSRPL